LGPDAADMHVRASVPPPGAPNHLGNPASAEQRAFPAA
jgi:hypothetical protein